MLRAQCLGLSGHQGAILGVDAARTGWDSLQRTTNVAAGAMTTMKDRSSVDSHDCAKVGDNNGGGGDGDDTRRLGRLVSMFNTGHEQHTSASRKPRR